MQRRDFIAGGLGTGFAGALTGGSAAARQSSGAGREIAVPIRVENNRVLVDVTLNEEGPLAFVIDTGAMVSGMRQEIADRLGLKPSRFVLLNGKRFPLYEVAEVGFGGVIRQPRVALFGLDNRIRLGGDGLLAAGVVTAMDSRLEYEAGVWRVFPDGAQPLPDGYETLRSEMKTNAHGLSLVPYAEISVNGAAQRTLWDTGGPRPVVMHHEAARGLGLLGASVPYAPIPFSGIQGGHPESGRMVRAASVTVGSHVYENILVAIQPPGVPRHYDALLGLPIMRTLDMAFDRSRRAFAVRRNGLTVGDEPRYGLSGVWLDEARGRVRVSAVGAGSPAAETGVRVGDVVTGVASLDEGIRLLSGPEGQARELRLQRGGQTVTARFELKAYL